MSFRSLPDFADVLKQALARRDQIERHVARSYRPVGWLSAKCRMAGTSGPASPFPPRETSGSSSCREDKTRRLEKDRNDRRWQTENSRGGRRLSGRGPAGFRHRQAPCNDSSLP